MSKRFPRVNLATVEIIPRKLILYGLFYRGLNHKLVGPTGTGKTVLATRLILDALREGEVPAHLDMEIGEQGSKDTYLAHGATDAEFAALHYLPFPNPTQDDVAEFVQSLIDEGETFAVFDKKPDFMRSLRMEENSNDDASDFYGTVTDPLRDKVTTVILAPTGHVTEYNRGGRGRGASESDYKYDLIWSLSVEAPFNRETVGRIALACTKDRWGYVGMGRVVRFEIGGDGQGGIVFNLLSSTLPVAGSNTAAPAPVNPGHSADPTAEALINAAIAAAKKVAPDPSHAVEGQARILAEMAGGGHRAERIAAIHAAAARLDTEDGVVEIDTGIKRGRNSICRYHFRAAQP